MALSLHAFFAMDFPERLAVLQVRRHEGGTSQPTLDVIRRLAIALGVSADMLVFDAAERGRSEALRYQFETISRLPEPEQEVARAVLDALIVKNQVAGSIERIAKPAAQRPALPPEEKRG